MKTAKIRLNKRDFLIVDLPVDCSPSSVSGITFSGNKWDLVGRISDMENEDFDEVVSSPSILASRGVFFSRVEQVVGARYEDFVNPFLFVKS